MTELEERLAGNDGEVLREDLQRQLGSIAERLHLQIVSSVPRSEFGDWQAAADAVAVAQEVLQTWVKGEDNVGRNL